MVMKSNPGYLLKYFSTLNIRGFTYLIFFTVAPREKGRSQLFKDSASMNTKFTPGGIKLAHTSSLRKQKDFASARAIDAIEANKNSEAIKMIPKFIQNADSKPEKHTLDHDLATLLYYKLTEHQYRGIFDDVNTAVKNLDWQMEKFRIIRLSHIQTNLDLRNPIFSFLKNHPGLFLV